MPARLDDLRPLPRRRHRYEKWWWRELCFLRAVLRQFRWRILVFVSVLAGGGVAFHCLERRTPVSLAKGVFYSWSLLFGQPPEDFPEAPLLQVLFFVIPIIGLTVFIEGLLQLATMVQRRNQNERSWSIIMAASLENHIILVGLGRLGFRVFNLLRKLGEAVVVIEADPRNQFLDAVRRDGSPLLIGDARREELLNDANVAAARSIVVAADDDLANLEIALDARAVRPDIKVVLRLFDQNMAEKIREGLDIGLAMSQSALSAPAFAVAALDASIVSSFVHDGHLIVTRRVTVQPGDVLAGHTIGESTVALGIGVLEQRTAGTVRLFPPPDAKLAPGDELVVQGRFQDLERLFV